MDRSVRAQHPGNVYRTCTYRRDRINSMSHRHPYEIHTLRRLSDLFCQRERFCVPARNKRSPSRFCTRYHPSLSSLSFSLSTSFRSLWGWVRVIITSVRIYDNTTSNVFSFSSYSPFSKVYLHAPCRSNYFVFRSVLEKDGDETEGKRTEKWR